MKQIISNKLEEGRDKAAFFSTINDQKILSKHPQRAKIEPPNPKNLDSFFLTDFNLYKVILSLPNGSAAGLDKIVPQNFEDLVS